MTPDEINTLLAKPLDAVLAVSRPSGGPQLTVVWFSWDGEAFYLSTTRDRAKYPNITRDPQVSLLVNDQAAHHYLAAYGRAEIVEDDYERIAALAAPIIAKHMPGAPPATAESQRADHRVIVVLRPDKLISR
jgi:PPOX class probable F420-dependent enzyme